MATTSTKQSWARGGLIFAATLMILIGVYQFFVGLAAVVQDNFFVVGPNYTYEIDTTAWGWIHMGIGVLAAVAGFFLFTGRDVGALGRHRAGGGVRRGELLLRCRTTRCGHC